jgi:hypothetical protein
MSIAPVEAGVWKGLRGAQGGMRHEKPIATQFNWCLLAGCAFRSGATRCVRCGNRCRPGLRRTSCLPVRLLWLVPLRVRTLRLLRTGLVRRWCVYWRRALVPRLLRWPGLLWPPRLLRSSRLLWPSGILWPLGRSWLFRLQGRRHSAWTGSLWTCASWRRNPWRLRARRLCAWRLCTGWFSRRWA